MLDNFADCCDFTVGVVVTRRYRFVVGVAQVGVATHATLSAD
jgi:hypothetical protein